MRWQFGSGVQRAVETILGSGGAAPNIPKNTRSMAWIFGEELSSGYVIQMWVNAWLFRDDVTLNVANSDPSLAPSNAKTVFFNRSSLRASLETG